MPSITLAKMGGYGDLIMASALFQPLIDKGFDVKFIASNYYSSVLTGHPKVHHLLSVPQDIFWDICEEENAHHLNYPVWWGSIDGQVQTRHIIDDWAESINLPMGLAPDFSHIPFTFEGSRRWSNTVVMQSKSNWSPYKDQPIETWNGIATLLTQEGFNVVQVGSPSDPRIIGAEFCYTNSPIDAISLIKHCKAFIGPDSVFQHMAKSVGTPAIVLWGSTNSAAFGYKSHMNVEYGLSCQPCYREYQHIEKGNSCKLVSDDGIPKCQVIDPHSIKKIVQYVKGMI